MSAAIQYRDAGCRQYFRDWRWFLKTSQTARWLVDPETGDSYVPFDRIRDQRNEDARYKAYADEPTPGQLFIGNGAEIQLLDVESLLPQLIVTPPSNQQPFRLAFVMEKSSVADILDPIAQEVKADLVPVTGELSTHEFMKWHPALPPMVAR